MSDPWHINSADQAAFAVDAILSQRERVERVREQCEHLVHLAEQELVRLEEWFLPQLQSWLRENPPARGKTLHLPTGSVAFRTVPGGPRVVDSGECLVWAREHLPAAVKTTECLAIDEVKAHIEHTGEIPPGADIVPDRESFDVKKVRKS